jgi:histone deacetylase 6
VYVQRATASHASVASPVRRSPRRAPPHTPPSVDADEGSAHLLAGVLAKAATSPLPLSSEPPSSSSPRFRPRKDTNTKETRDESAKPKLVVRYKRDAVAAAGAASAASAASDASASASASFVSAAASFASERLVTSGHEEGSSRAAATEATAAVLARASSVASAASASAASSSFRPKGTEECEQKPNRRGAELRASLPHSTPTRKARSKRDTRPRHSETSSRLSAFATFREQRRSALAEKNERKKASSSPNARARPEELADHLGGDDGALFKDTEVDALADALAVGVTLDVTPSRRTPARALALADPKIKVGLCYSDVMELHAGPAFHFERPARHAETVERFKRRGLEARCVPIEARPATDAELLLVHSQTHLDAVRTTFDASSDAAETQGEGDIYWTKHTETCARVAAGSAAAAALAVASGALHRAFAVVRPPGHHAECARAMGFCFFNNTVVAARAALTAYPERIKKVLLVDWDVHHGNGIQDLTYDDDAILYVSLHRRQEGFYPETGDADEIGIGKGRGHNVNVPWPEKGLSDADYLAAFDLLVSPVASAFAPDLVIVAAGYDAAEGDPLGGMRVSDQGFALMTERLQALAGGRIVCALEGGYGLTATANAAAATLGAMLGFKTPALGSRRRPRRSTVELLRSMCDGDLAECWPVLRSPAHVDALREAARGTTPARAKERADEKRAPGKSPVSGGAEKTPARPTVFAVPVPATPTRRAATPT